MRVRRWKVKTERMCICGYYTFAHRATKMTIVKNKKCSGEVLMAVVPQTASGERLDKVLPQIFPPYSRSQLQAWLKEGRVTLDREIPAARLAVFGGETLRLEVPPLPVSDWLPEALPISVVY